MIIGLIWLGLAWLGLAWLAMIMPSAFPFLKGFSLRPLRLCGELLFYINQESTLFVKPFFSQIRPLATFYATKTLSDKEKT